MSEGEARHEPDHPVTVKVNNRDVVLPSAEDTGAEIKHAAGVPETFKLFGPDGAEISNDQRVRVHEHERFTAISGQDVS